MFDNHQKQGIPSSTICQFGKRLPIYSHIIQDVAHPRRRQKKTGEEEEEGEQGGWGLSIPTLEGQTSPFGLENSGEPQKGDVCTTNRVSPISAQTQIFHQ